MIKHSSRLIIYTEDSTYDSTEAVLPIKRNNPW